jgi:hypothetical protein
MPEMTAEQAGCDHDNFSALVRVNRMSEETGGPITSYNAEIKIECGKCRVAFRFLGCPQGVSFHRPMTSPDDCELRVPIQPGKGLPNTTQRFEMPPRKEK